MLKLSGRVLAVSRVSLGFLTGRRIPSVSMGVFPEHSMEIPELMGWSEISVARESKSEGRDGISARQELHGNEKRSGI